MQVRHMGLGAAGCFLLVGSSKRHMHWRRKVQALNVLPCARYREEWKPRQDKRYKEYRGNILARMRARPMIQLLSGDSDACCRHLVAKHSSSVIISRHNSYRVCCI